MSTGPYKIVEDGDNLKRYRVMGPVPADGYHISRRDATSACDRANAIHAAGAASREAEVERLMKALQMAVDALDDPHKMSKGAEALSAAAELNITPTNHEH
jgi:hypothetical protein